MLEGLEEDRTGGQEETLQLYKAIGARQLALTELENQLMERKQELLCLQAEKDLVQEEVLDGMKEKAQGTL
jgi:hypothetical protein